MHGTIPKMVGPSGPQGLTASAVPGNRSNEPGFGADNMLLGLLKGPVLLTGLQAVQAHLTDKSTPLCGPV